MWSQKKKTYIFVKSISSQSHIEAKIRDEIYKRKDVNNNNKKKNGQ